MMMTYTPLGTGVICSMSLPALDCYSDLKMHDKQERQRSRRGKEGRKNGRKEEPV